MSNKKTTQVNKSKQRSSNKRTATERKIGNKTGNVSIVESIPNDYQFELGFEQSVSSGVLGIKGKIRFNSNAMFSVQEDFCLALQAFEVRLDKMGYLLAKDYAPKKATNGGEEKTYSRRRGNHNHMESDSTS